MTTAHKKPRTAVLLVFVLAMVAVTLQTTPAEASSGWRNTTATSTGDNWRYWVQSGKYDSKYGVMYGPSVGEANCTNNYVYVETSLDVVSYSGDFAYIDDVKIRVSNESYDYDFIGSASTTYYDTNGNKVGGPTGWPGGGDSRVYAGTTETMTIPFDRWVKLNSLNWPVEISWTGAVEGHGGDAYCWITNTVAYYEG